MLMIEVGCPKLAIGNGIVDYKRDDLGQILSAIYTCLRGFDLVGSSERQCDHEKWLGNDPICLHTTTGMKTSNLLLLL